jgi:hypothetical protein
MCDWEGYTTGTIGLPNPNQRRVAKTSGFPHPLYIQVHRAGFLRERILALGDEGITPMGHRLRQGIALFSVRIEFWRSTGQPTSQHSFLNMLDISGREGQTTLLYNDELLPRPESRHQSSGGMGVCAQ